MPLRLNTERTFFGLAKEKIAHAAFEKGWFWVAYTYVFE